MSTFGKTAIGASFSNLANQQQAANKYAPASSGTVTKMTMQLRNSHASNQGVICAIWADSAGVPGARLAQSNEVTIVAGQAAGLVDFVISLAVTGGTNYWLGYWGDTISAQAEKAFDTGAAGSDQFRGSVVGGPSNPFGASSGFTDLFTVYATYDATPVNSVAPAVSGSAVVGSTLSTTDGTWTASPTFTYQWTRDGANIAAATASTYVTVAGDVGHAIGCTVTATNGVSSASQASSNTITVTAPAVATGFGGLRFALSRHSRSS